MLLSLEKEKSIYYSFEIKDNNNIFCFVMWQEHVKNNLDIIIELINGKT